MNSNWNPSALSNWNPYTSALEIASPGTVYVMAPMTMYGKKSLASRKRFLENILPGANLFYPDELFVNNDDWLERIHGIVSECDCGILVSPQNRIVGKGCFWEVDLLKQAEKHLFYLDYQKKILTAEFSLCKLPGDDWISYALVELSNVKQRTV